MSRRVKPKSVLSTCDADSLRLALQMSEFKERVGRRIADARDAKGWTQVQLARHMPSSVDGATISRWEKGKVMPTVHLDALAEALDVDPSYFMAPEPEPATPDLIGALATDSPQQQLDRIESMLREVLDLLRAQDIADLEADLDDVAPPDDARETGT